MALKPGKHKSFVASVAVMVVAVGVILVACGTSKVEVPRTFEPATFSESDARETLGAAVQQECSKSSIGVSGLVGPLRRVESATATKISDGWNFRLDGKVATVSPSGVVAGELLKDLTSDC